MAHLEAPSSSPDSSSREEAGILDLLVLLLKHRRKLLMFPLALALVGVLGTFVLPVRYTASTSILPPQQSQSNAVAILGQLGAIGSTAGAAFGLKDPNDVFIAMLKSRVVADNIIRRFDLMSLYGQRFLTEARLKLASYSKIKSGKDQVISIDFEDSDPTRAAAIANAYVQELEALTLRLAVGESSTRRMYFENQVRKTKSDLGAAEEALRKVKERYGFVQLEGQVALTIAASASLRAQITAKEMQMTGLASFATETNRDYVRAKNELLGLRKQLDKLENNISKGKGDVLLPLGSTGQSGLEYMNKYREVRYQEALLDFLSKNYETARLDEAKNATLVQVLDPAITPENRSWPRARVIVPALGFIGLMISVIWMLIDEWIERIQRNPEHARKWQKVQEVVPRWARGRRD